MCNSLATKSKVKKAKKAFLRNKVIYLNKHEKDWGRSKIFPQALLK